ncbi:MAG TPA: class I SAM-dependent methyltransferase, partial [Ilumatobacteraceae bacterium]|nr:class I SAM-dependent methyltransferase [Ilumatobacteraceae bacterium]
DIDATVALLVSLAAPSVPAPVVELGSGTGRLAFPLARAIGERTLIAIDSSPEMLAVAERKGPPSNVVTITGDMVEVLRGPDVPAAGLVFVAYNTFFNLTAPGAQQACFDAVAARLAPGGCFVIEAFVPDDRGAQRDHVEVRSMTAAHVVLSISRFDGDHGAAGQFVEFSEKSGIRLRPWHIVYASPAELDAMAARAGLTLHARWEDTARTPFTPDSQRHVSVYTPPT